MDNAFQIDGAGAVAPEIPATRPGDTNPENGAAPAGKWKKVRFAHIASASEVLGTLGGASQPMMRVYEATIEYHLVSLGEDIALVSPREVYRYMADVLDRFPMNETFWVIMLNRKNKAIARHLCTSGTLTSSLVHPREVFRPAILASAAAIVVVHNHPSGDPAPSSADIQATRQLREASKVIDVQLIDHLVIGRPESDPVGKGYYSFREAGLV